MKKRKKMGSSGLTIGSWKEGNQTSWLPMLHILIMKHAESEKYEIDHDSTDSVSPRLNLEYFTGEFEAEFVARV